MTEENQNNEQPKQEVTKNRRLLKRVQEVQENAENASGSCVSKELTYQQAFSIVLRSRQLEQEGDFHPSSLNKRELQRQIEVCYKQQYR